MIEHRIIIRKFMYLKRILNMRDSRLVKMKDCLKCTKIASDLLMLKLNMTDLKANYSLTNNTYVEDAENIKKT